jgi:hypothetical protein
MDDMVVIHGNCTDDGDSQVWQLRLRRVGVTCWACVLVLMVGGKAEPCGR